jgi:SAM-dependent methyltransferase
MIDEKKIREKLFHNNRFKDGSDNRKILNGIYSITTDSDKFYKKLTIDSLKSSSILLEYGCGPGGDLIFYKSLNLKIYGIDISEEAVSSAQNSANILGLNALFSVQDAENTNFENEFFDVVIGTGILHHLDLHASLSELSRIVKNSGCCIFSEPMGHNALINLFRFLTPKMRSDDEHPLLMSDIKLMKNYFNKVDVNYFYSISLLSILFKGTILFNGIYRTLRFIEDSVYNVFPFFKKYSWICVVKMSEPLRNY